MDEMTDKQFEALINLIIAIVKTSENADEAIANIKEAVKGAYKKNLPPTKHNKFFGWAVLPPSSRLNYKPAERQSQYITGRIFQ